MTSTPLVVQCIQFYANGRCMADPSLFQALRDTVQHGWQERGLKAQYWGSSEAKANELYWLLLWESHEQATAFKADPSYATIVQEREALATTPPASELHIRFSGNPLHAIQAPVTEVDFYETTDKEADPEAKPAAETQEMIRHAIHYIDSLQSTGFVAISWGPALEDRRRGVTLAGWKTVEDHMRMGTLDEHKEFVEIIEAIFSNLASLTVSHVRFKLHDTMPSK